MTLNNFLPSWYLRWTQPQIRFDIFVFFSMIVRRRRWRRWRRWRRRRRASKSRPLTIRSAKNGETRATSFSRNSFSEILLRFSAKKKLLWHFFAVFWSNFSFFFLLLQEDSFETTQIVVRGPDVVVVVVVAVVVVVVVVAAFKSCLRLF